MFYKFCDQFYFSSSIKIINLINKKYFIAHNIPKLIEIKKSSYKFIFAKSSKFPFLIFCPKNLFVKF